jgi:hypothetical protein
MFVDSVFVFSFYTDLQIDVLEMQNKRSDLCAFDHVNSARLAGLVVRLLRACTPQSGF